VSDSRLCSMTGFGVGRSQLSGRHACVVEVRSVNNRHLKASVRVPEGLTSLVPRLEGLVRDQISRGTVYLTLRLTNTGDSAGARLNRELLTYLYGEVSALAQELKAEPPRLDTLCLAEGVVSSDEVIPEADEVWPTVAEAAGAALGELLAMRRTEGAGLGVDLSAIVADMRSCAASIEAAAPAAVAAESARLRERISELAGELEPAELAREVALLADRADISEELQRWRSHLEQVETTLAYAKGPVGRKLEFLAQELLREANTMGSKCRDGALVQQALELKLCVERLKEQLANLE
jgi:uncharacterized protein (TIGR00255 family)